MEFFINYLLESSIILGILTIFYRFVLHHEPLFKFNRIYLLFSLLLATVVPLIHISIYKNNAANTQGFVNLLDTVNVFAGDMRQTVVPAIADNQSFSWIYMLGAIGLLLRLLIGIVRLGGLSKKANWQKINGVKIADLPGRFNPFSFFHVIFINRSLYSDNDLDKIMVHEMAHVKHKHSIDVLLFESLLIVQWFNPFAWLIKYLLKELHEFQADRSVLNKGTSVGSYKNLLLYQATGARLLPVNNFNQSITKKRFKMMTNKTIKNKAFIKTLVAVAVIFGIGLFFACDNAVEEVQDGNLKSAEIEKVYDVVDVMPAFPKGELALRKFIAINVKYPNDAKEQGKAGRVYVQFIVSKTGEVKDAKIARSAGFESLDAEAIRVISSLPDWEPGMKNGAKVDVSFTIPINFSLQDKDGSTASKEKEGNSSKEENENGVHVVGYSK
ncbi:M56 family metallopeptidase [Labilibacter marinus]|uniref:M56 family metallopeptidase n=1 Tax=Labilibacter marinus TaxID=1477105 RepID=UPI00094F5016|nr:M56 family metallopeptidase [Labilibacter marinus]